MSKANIWSTLESRDLKLQPLARTASEDTLLPSLDRAHEHLATKWTEGQLMSLLRKLNRLSQDMHLYWLPTHFFMEVSTWNALGFPKFYFREQFLPNSAWPENYLVRFEKVDHWVPTPEILTQKIQSRMEKSAFLTSTPTGLWFWFTSKFNRHCQSSRNAGRMRILTDILRTFKHSFD